MSAATAEITLHELYVPPATIERRTLGHFAGPYTTPDRILEATWLASMRCHRDSPSFQRWVGYYLAVIHRAEALDIPLGVAIDHIYVNDDNRAGLTATLMGALLLRAGIVWKPVVYTDAKVKLKFTRRGGRKVIATTEWTMTMAVRAKLAHRIHWQRYPERCLAARALSLFCRDHAADVVLWGHTWDEIRNGEYDTADHDPAADLPPRVAELLDQVNADNVTAEDIRRIIAAVKKTEKNLLDVHIGNGQPLSEALNEAWLAAANREATALIDVALADTGPAQPLPAAPALPDDVEHASAGTLPGCGCDAAIHARTGQHSKPNCRLALARWSG